MNRFQAFGIHFGISLVIFAVLAALVLYVWYPGFFFETDGGWQGMRIIVLVDLVLGPLLTLIVYKAGKPGLRTDLTIIGALQGVCLLAGTYLVYMERPLGLIYADGQFNSVSADSFKDAQQPIPDFGKYPGGSPKWLTVELPEDPIEQSKLRRAALRKRQPTALLTDYYVPFDSDSPLFQDDSTPVSRIKERDYQGRGWEDFSARFSDAENAYLFYPYAARFEYFFLAFSKEDLQFVGTLTPAHWPTPESAESPEASAES